MGISLSIIILGVVFLLIAIRQVGNVKLQIWQIMLGGALLVLITGQITPLNALKSIDIDVMLFLFGMFVIGRALEESGYLSHLSYKLFKKTKHTDSLLLAILFGFGFLSAFLMNDTIAIIGTPVVLLLSRKHAISPKPLLLALAFSVTIGSVMSPIGNPQNFLIAMNGNGNFYNVFLEFFKYLLIPTILSLFLAYFIIKLFYKGDFNKNGINHSQEPIKDHKLAILSKISLILVMALILIKIALVLFKVNLDFRLTYIALIGMLPILLFSKRRIETIRKIDWHTLIFFASMFILMESVWDSGFFQNLITNLNLNILSLSAIFGVSIILSQLISNVPLVALYSPLLLQAGATSKELIALAAGSTLAGCLLILGAASNIIIIQNAEKREKTKDHTITFLEFARIGIPLTILSTLIYYVFLLLMP